MSNQSSNSKFFICCKEATELVVKNEITTLSLHEKLAMKFHLLICKVCRIFKNQSEEINKILIREDHSGENNVLSEQKKQECNSLIKNLTNDGA